MATQSERNADADKWASRTESSKWQDGTENPKQTVSEGLSQYLGEDVPTSVDDDWEEGVNSSDAAEKYDSNTSDSSRWLDAFEDVDNWNTG